MDIKEKFDKIRIYCNENSGFLSMVLGFIGILTYIFGNRTIGITFFSITIIWGLWYLISDHLKKYNKILIIMTTIISIFFISYLSYNYFYGNPKIYDLTKGFNLKFEDNFEGGNLKNDDNFKWIIKDNKFTNSNKNGKTLITSSIEERGYPIFQELKELKGDRLIISKFYLPDGGRIGLQFANTKGQKNKEVFEDHYQECRVSSYDGIGVNSRMQYHKGVGDLLYKRKVIYGPFNDINITSGNYYILAIVSNNKLSCYYQEEGDKNYKEIIVDKPLEFENLGGPVITRFIDDKNSYPIILDFKLYSKN